MCSVLYLPSPWVKNYPNWVVFNPVFFRAYIPMYRRVTYAKLISNTAISLAAVCCCVKVDSVCWHGQIPRVPLKDFWPCLPSIIHRRSHVTQKFLARLDFFPLKITLYFSLSWWCFLLSLTVLVIYTEGKKNPETSVKKLNKNATTLHKIQMQVKIYIFWLTELGLYFYKNLPLVFHNFIHL